MSEQSKYFELEMITPAGVTIKKEVLHVQAPGVTGYFGIKTNHLPLITSLTIGQLTAKTDSGILVYAISRGYAEVSQNKMTILAETIEKSSDIDMQRAERSKERAAKRLKDKNAELNVTRANASMKRALNRMSIGSTYQQIY
jgi:F-type H+-transporting ATPase subunit epsilon